MKMPEEVIETEKSIGRVWKFKQKVKCKKVFWWTIHKHYLLIILYKKIIFIYFLEFFLSFLLHDDMMKQKGKDQVSGIILQLYCLLQMARWCRRGYKVNFSRIGDFTSRVSDCEELVGVISGDDVVDFGGL